MTLRFVISGTDTGVGKTIFSAALTKALDAFYWKPIQSGMIEETDSEIVSRLGQISKNRILPEAWKLHTPVSPHLSAQIDKVILNPKKLNPPHTKSPLVIEGAGGLLVPLTESILFADVFAEWKISVILCARTELGTINHTLLSLEAMRNRFIPIFGVVFIGNENLNTQNTISTLGNVRILGRLPFLQPLTAENLHHSFNKNFILSDFK